MKLRAQLTLAYLVLAFAPLAGIVLFSYFASERAFRQAVEGETRVLAEELGDRMGAVREDLNRLVERLAGLPFLELLKAWEEEAGGVGNVYAELMSELGETAPLVESLEFVPLGSTGSGTTPAPDDEIGARDAIVIHPSKTLAEAVRKLGSRRDRGLRENGDSAGPMDAAIRQVVRRRSTLEAEEIEALEAMEGEASNLLGMEFSGPVHYQERVVGYVKAQVRAQAVLRHVLSRTRRAVGEVPFAIDVDGVLYFTDPRDEELVAEALAQEQLTGHADGEGWIIAHAPDPESSLTFGVAHPIRESLRDMRRATVRNFGYGLSMIVLALAGILLWSARLTNKVALLSTSANQLAAGDLDARVELSSKDELGQLAATFNRMAGELEQNQQRLLFEERQRKDQEIQRRLLAAENERKSRELEEARRFQLSLLPKEIPSPVHVEVAVFMRTATEVGGDYYDFHQTENGVLTAAIGDATGHGAKAGTMVTVVKGLFAVSAGEPELPRILREATRAIRWMNLDRMNMALTLVRLEDRKVTVSSAGMPPALLYRQVGGTVSELDLEGTPLGGLADFPYRVWESELDPGDTLLLMTDGFPELLNAEDEPIGYDRVQSVFRAAASRAPEEIIADLVAATETWNGGEPPDDDITFLVLKAKA